MEMFRANSDIIKRLRAVATLDSSTCFIAGTKVLTGIGESAIETIVAGDVVIGGSGNCRRVLGTLKKQTTRLCVIRLENGQKITCTPDHRFWNGETWIEAGDLKAGFVLADRL
jgi:intein/homing endonuclease